MNNGLFECSLGHHEFTMFTNKYTNNIKVLVCKHCKRKCEIKWYNRHECLTQQALGDLVNNKIVHFKIIETNKERWLSNGGGNVYDKRGDCMRPKRQYWLRRKPKNWKYEGMLI